MTFCRIQLFIYDISILTLIISGSPRLLRSWAILFLLPQLFSFYHYLSIGRPLDLGFPDIFCILYVVDNKSLGMD